MVILRVGLPFGTNNSKVLEFTIPLLSLPMRQQQRRQRKRRDSTSEEKDKHNYVNMSLTFIHVLIEVNHCCVVSWMHALRQHLLKFESYTGTFPVYDGFSYSVLGIHTLFILYYTVICTTKNYCSSS